MARWSKAKWADWLARYRVAGSLYAQDTCGCIMFVVVDMPEEVAAASKEIAGQLAKGRDIKHATRDPVTGVLNMPPHYCAAHQRGT
jgi:hypothetical protein